LAEALKKRARALGANQILVFFQVHSLPAKWQKISSIA
jgi:hypothetical protein